jgi:thiamine biosynthesis lipoprotein
MTTQVSYPLWGGIATVAVTDPDRLAAARAAVDEVIEAVDAACSGYRDDSDLARVNAGAGSRVRVGATFLEVLRVALHAADLTGGLVDPTAVGGRSTAGPGRRGRRSVLSDADTAYVPPGLRLDFGAVGKAFAVDRAAAAASAAAGCGVLVALAGDIAVAGPVPVAGWPVRVCDDHRPGPRGELPPGQDVTLRAPGGLATSSLAVRTRRLADGRTVTHVIDPRTGMPVRGPWRTVSVSAGTCVDANTASTAALVRGHGAGGWLAAHGLPSRLVHGEGWVHTIAGWPDDHSERPGVKVAG